MRTSNSFWVVLREASRLQCSVASNCARIEGEASSFGVAGRSALDMVALLDIAHQHRDCLPVTPSTLVASSEDQ
jgi:hypothetical protein